jgi:hypothetical protein
MILYRNKYKLKKGLNLRRKQLKVCYEILKVRHKIWGRKKIKREKRKEKKKSLMQNLRFTDLTHHHIMERLPKQLKHHG